EMFFAKQLPILAAGCGLLVDCAVFTEIGGFDTHLSTCADWDFCYRAAGGGKVAFVSEPLIRVRTHSANMHLTNVGRLERDMLYAYAKVFSDPDPAIQRLRRKCYGDLHMVLAGSFFHARRPYSFISHLLKSLWLTPCNVAYPLGLPRRWGQRALRSAVQ